MMKIKLLFLMIVPVLFGCSSDKDDKEMATEIRFTFIHKWGETVITNQDFNTIQFTNGFGNELSIERLRYLISKIKLTKSTGEVVILNEYTLIDLENSATLSFIPSQMVNIGSYSNISFIFGFTNEDNTDGAYSDLNSASWNVPAMLGGGYHYMQLDGKYRNNTGVESGYNYHAIRAVDPGINPTFPQDTFFEVNLGAIAINENTEIIIAMDIAQWFENPYLWDLNVYHQMLMPNSSAQILMHDNGQNVFNLESVE